MSMYLSLCVSTLFVIYILHFFTCYDFPSKLTCSLIVTLERKGWKYLLKEKGSVDIVTDVLGPYEVESDGFTMAPVVFPPCRIQHNTSCCVGAAAAKTSKDAVEAAGGFLDIVHFFSSLL